MRSIYELALALISNTLHLFEKVKLRGEVNSGIIRNLQGVFVKSCDLSCGDDFL